MKQMTKKEVSAINDYYIRNMDKFWRMYAGVSSQLLFYRDGILYIEIQNSEKNILSTFNTAVAFANRWRDYNDELKNAQGFVVVFKKINRETGFALSTNEGKDALVKQLTASMTQLYQQNDKAELSHIYSSVFTAGMDSVGQDLRKRPNRTT
jgi:hypothetical protein